MDPFEPPAAPPTDDEVLPWARRVLWHGGSVVIWSHAVLGPAGLLMGCYGNVPLLQACLWGAIGTAAAGAVLLGLGAVLAALRPTASWASLRDEPRRLHRVLRFVAAWILIAGMAGVTWSMGGDDPYVLLKWLFGSVPLGLGVAFVGWFLTELGDGLMLS